MNTFILLFCLSTVIGVVLTISIDGYDNNNNYGGYDSSSEGGYYGSGSHHHPHHHPHHHNNGYTTVTACPDGWTSFDRVKGKWCIRVFSEPKVASAAEAACQAHGAKLTGLENNNERLFIHSESLKFLGNDAYTVTAIGARRRAPCYAANWLSLPECMPKATRSFEWTDGFTTGDGGWGGWWRTNPVQPDNFETGQSYVAIYVLTGKWLSHPAFVGQVAPMDDVASNAGLAAYACGRQPETKRVPN